MAETTEEFADISAKRLASVYAQALLNSAEAAHDVPRVLEEIDSLVDDVLAKNAHLRELLFGAAVGRKRREEAIEKAFKGRACDIVFKFLLVLNTHERLDMIRHIRHALHELNDERRRHLRVFVYSAQKLTDDFRKRIADEVQKRFQLDPILVPIVDPTLLGGLKLRIGDQVLDATVRSKLDNLRNQLIEKSSHEIQSRRDRFSSAE
ncbi:MAG: ATP synthase F1 subunit delta [Verrucomicrobiae bacterium]|nr:ATP synthase F1 subunit delta [Verrucomicrobiae bacterium]